MVPLLRAENMQFISGKKNLQIQKMLRFFEVI